MPELILEIGGRVYEVACEAGQEPMLERAGRLLDTEATRIGEEGRATEKRMLLLAGLMLGDTMTALESELRATEERLRQAEDRARIAEAKSAMLAANALKHETEASHRFSSAEMAEIREENEAAAMLIGQAVNEINALAEAVGAAA
jgi:cell division protein ZapA